MRRTGLSGEGLDLLLMQHFADRAGIELQIESAPDKGTVVRALCFTEPDERAVRMSGVRYLWHTIFSWWTITR
jgi:hypothetical protein